MCKTFAAKLKPLMTRNDGLTSHEVDYLSETHGVSGTANILTEHGIGIIAQLTSFLR